MNDNLSMGETMQAREARRPGFDAWKAKVDALIQRKTGLSADDLPDFCYVDAFDDGATPAQTARDAIRAARDF